MKSQRVLVTCPRCGHTQPEPPLAYSSICRKCREHFRVQDVLHPRQKPADAGPELRSVNCFKCATELTVPASAQSSMCKRCGSHVDLRDYHIANAVSKNFHTKGRLVLEPGGFLFNTDSVAGEVVLKGRLLGKIRAEGLLEIHSSAEIKGSFAGGMLRVPPGQQLGWPQLIRVDGADIAGELAARLAAAGRVVLRSSARFFGTIQACQLVVEEGAVLDGAVRVCREAAADQSGQLSS